MKRIAENRMPAPKNVDISKKDTDIIRTLGNAIHHPHLRGKLFFIRTFVESFPCNFGTVGA